MNFILINIRKGQNHAIIRYNSVIITFREGESAMAARNSAKALVYHEGRILLNRCMSRFGEYYALPGGGQKNGELLTEAVKRELKEETGLSVKPIRMCAIYECISQRRSDENNHKLYCIFLCSLADEKAVSPTEPDACQIDQQWVPLEEIRHINLFPRIVRNNIGRMIKSRETLYLGSERKK